MAATFRLEGDLMTNLEGFDERAMKGIIAAAGLTATMAESMMKSEAPWTDQTGAARNGLRAKVQTSSSKCAIILYHSVPYGVFLELRWDGKYQIIRPTMAAAGPFWLEAISKVVF